MLSHGPCDPHVKLHPAHSCGFHENVAHTGTFPDAGAVKAGSSLSTQATRQRTSTEVDSLKMRPRMQRRFI
eukprot:5793163-Amphidinium_carterae.4